MVSRLDHKKDYNNELLGLLMPNFVLERISFDREETFLAEDAGNVVIIFVELCNYNKLL